MENKTNDIARLTDTEIDLRPCPSQIRAGGEMRRVTPYSIFRGLLTTVLALALIGVFLFLSWIIAIFMIVTCGFAVISSETGSECWEKITYITHDIWDSLKECAYAYKETWTQEKDE